MYGEEIHFRPQTEAPLYVFIIVNQFEIGITRKFSHLRLQGVQKVTHAIRKYTNVSAQILYYATHANLAPFTAPAVLIQHVLLLTQNNSAPLSLNEPVRAAGGQTVGKSF